MIAELVLAAALVSGGASATTTLDGVHVHLEPGTQQVVTVNHTDGYHARVAFWTLTGSGWKARFSADDGRIGYGGLVRGTRRKQGTGTTPLGTYGLPWAFGMAAADDHWKLRYRQVVPGDFWVEPVLVVDIETHGVGYQRLRQPSYRGLRADLKPSDL